MAQGAAIIIGSLFTNEKQKRLARDVYGTFASHDGLGYDVSATARDYVFATFKRRI